MRRTGPIVHWDNCLKLHEALWATRFLQLHTKKDSYLFIAGEIIECQSVAVSAGGEGVYWFYVACDRWYRLDKREKP